uniref:Ecdysoneless homolog (Drosophila) n=1 Tax=Mastacembelus armatus TaxID=205130 RepID=A0A7N9AXI8_9TELE
MNSLERRAIQEDLVQYKLFLIQPDGSSLQQTEEQLSHLVEEVMAKIAPLLIQYLWQHQSFNLKYHPEKGGAPAHIGGSTQFGDNVEDEWFIVYLLQQITEAFPELAARVEDNDGEFLLIEAADYLPKWLNPDTSENRVFFYRGQLHILPCPSTSSPVGIPKDVVPTVAQALALLSTHPGACQASPKISSALSKRLEGYPEKVKTGLHRARCFIPAGIAKVLAQRPDLVAPAVSAFYLRDPVDLQACRTFKTFPPDTRVLTLVTFTRCLYAQLHQQQFTPDRRSGFTLPPRSHPQYKAHELGMKLAHGFEILCSKCRLPSSEPDAPVSCNPQWKSFMDSLTRNSYFRGELEGSARYRELLRSAENFFKQSVASNSSVLSPGEEVLQLLHSCNSFSLEELKKQELQLPQEDSDSWLDITAQDLERMLQERKERRKEQVKESCHIFVSLLNLSFKFLLGGKEEELDSDDLDDDDDDDDDEEEKEEGFAGQPEMNGTETLDSLRQYMDQMDEELMSTNIGQSFIQTAGVEDTEEEIQPLDLDLNLVTNLLESLSCQAGLAGPASNLLQSLGLHLPPNSDSS